MYSTWYNIQYPFESMTIKVACKETVELKVFLKCTVEIEPNTHENVRFGPSISHSTHNETTKADCAVEQKHNISCCSCTDSDNKLHYIT